MTPPPFTSEQVYNRVCHVEVILGKHRRIVV